ncbi:MAG: DUF4328 domain-containing protein [Acidimicrobiales bacterium]
MDSIRRWIDEIRINSETPPSNTLPTGLAAIGPVDILGLARLVLLIIFSFSAATHARDLGIRSILQPFWAILAWLLPVVNLFFPYWVLRDCLPPNEERARHRLLTWWLLLFASSLVGVAAIVVDAVFGPVGFAILPVQAVILAIGIRFGMLGLDSICRAQRTLTEALSQPRPASVGYGQ